MSKKTELNNLRDEINKVTIEIIRLCGERFSLAREIGELKAQMELPIEDLKVEENLKREVLEKCCLFDIDAKFGLKLLDLLLSESKKVQKTYATDNK